MLLFQIVLLINYFISESSLGANIGNNQELIVEANLTLSDVNLQDDYLNQTFIEFRDNQLTIEFSDNTSTIQPSPTLITSANYDSNNKILTIRILHTKERKPFLVSQIKLINDELQITRQCAGESISKIVRSLTETTVLCFFQPGDVAYHFSWHGYLMIDNNKLEINKVTIDGLDSNSFIYQLFKYIAIVSIATVACLCLVTNGTYYYYGQSSQLSASSIISGFMTKVSKVPKLRDSFSTGRTESFKEAKSVTLLIPSKTETDLSTKEETTVKNDKQPTNQPKFEEETVTVSKKASLEVKATNLTCLRPKLNLKGPKKSKSKIQT